MPTRELSTRRIKMERSCDLQPRAHRYAPLSPRAASARPQCPSPPRPARSPCWTPILSTPGPAAGRSRSCFRQTPPHPRPLSRCSASPRQPFQGRPPFKDLHQREDRCGHWLVRESCTSQQLRTCRDSRAVPSSRVRAVEPPAHPPLRRR